MQAGVQPAVNVLIKSQYRRLTFPQDIQRVAVGDTEILSAEVISSRELLLLGRETGRTTLIVWFANGLSSEYRFSVERDLSLLERALKSIDASIEVESAPDRDALVLTGTVPDINASMAAEAIARNYLDAGGTRLGGAQPLIASPSVVLRTGRGTLRASPRPQRHPRRRTRSCREASLQRAPCINLIQLQTPPPLPEQKIQEAIRQIGGQNVTIRRILRGNVRDDAVDTLVLDGRVPNQIALVRVLTIAARLFAGQTLTADDIRVRGGRSRRALEQAQTQSSAQTQLGGGATSSLFGGAAGRG